MGLRTIHNPGVPIELRLGALSLTAFSISGLATYVMVPAYDAVFDLGHCPLEATRLRNVFLSHVHQDHSAGVPRHLAVRQMVGAKPSKVYCPAESAGGLRGVLRAFEAMEEKPPADLDAIVCGVAPGDTVVLNRRVEIDAFDVDHRIASRGYTVFEKRQVLRSAFVGLPSADIVAARERGETVTDTHRHPAFTYIGDSTIETLERHPEVGQSEVLFLEVTHLPGTDPAVSEAWGHTHLDHLIEFARRHPEALASPHIVLKHFSMKYSDKEIRQVVDALPADLRQRVTLLV